MGNSITEGWKNLNPEFFEDNPSYICRGISGQVTAQMLARFRADVINLKPQAVVILAGTNDIAMNQGYVEIDHIFENIVSMTELAKYNKIKVVLCSVLPAAKHGWRKELSPEESVSKIAELNARIKEYADANKIPYADYYSVMEDENKALKKEYQRDDVHPNKEGYLVMDKVIKEVLNKNFKL
jgi:alpha-L-fucosidase